MKGEFPNAQVSHTIAHYLVAISHLLKEQGYARNIDIAKHLGRTRGSVSMTLKHMEQRGLVMFDENKFVKLTELGAKIGEQCMGAKRAVSLFLHRVLGVNMCTALRDACRIEHQLSSETITRLTEFMRVR
jgi:DtxR family Mn-dependent transcriptional regulator